MTLTCCRCKGEKPTTEFYVDRTARNKKRGYSYACRECSRKAVNRRRQEKREQAATVEITLEQHSAFFAKKIGTGRVTTDRRAEVCPWLRGGTR